MNKLLSLPPKEVFPCWDDFIQMTELEWIQKRLSNLAIISYYADEDLESYSDEVLGITMTPLIEAKKS
uniref:Uncharacterized protein n=1 Tax=Acrobeloides nanus TaxID=290746 RepID=A0A914EKM4_9BILA